MTVHRLRWHNLLAYGAGRQMLKYDTTVDATANTSHALMLALVGGRRDVLDVGCSTGYLAEALTAAGNRVAGVEVDPAAAEKARPHLTDLLVADLESADLAGHFGAGSFDVVVFGDVLEHLRDPGPVLRRAVALLRPGGSVVLSIPNVAHGSVRLSLLQGSWRYRDLGLLDETHIRFFTRDSVEDLLAGAGLVAVERRRTTAPPLGTEIEVDPTRLLAGALTFVEADDDAWTYQFVWRAVRDDADGRVRAQAARLEDARRENDRLSSELDAERGAREAAEAQLAAVNATRTMRLTRPLRAVVARARGGRA